MVLFAACSGAPPIVPSVVESAPGEASIAALQHALRAGDSDAAQRELRRRMAFAAEDGVDAALVLVDHYASIEALEDAEAVIEAACAHLPPSYPLQLCRARVLRDLGRWQDAADELRRAIDTRPDRLEARVASVETSYVLGLDGDVLAAVSELRTDPDLDPNDRAYLDELARLARIRESGEARPRLALELFATMRSAAETVDRQRAFDVLAESVDARPAALRVGLLNNRTEVRIHAVRALRADDPSVEDWLEAMFEDEEPTVRGAVAIAIGQLDCDPKLLLDHLLVEDDPYAFRCVHRALRTRIGPYVALAASGPIDPDTRRKTHDAWRRHWTR